MQWYVFPDIRVWLLIWFLGSRTPVVHELFLSLLILNWLEILIIENACVLFNKRSKYVNKSLISVSIFNNFKILFY